MSDKKRIYTTPEKAEAWRCGYGWGIKKIKRGAMATYQTAEGAAFSVDNGNVAPAAAADFRMWFLAGWNDALAGEPVDHVGIRLPPEPAPAHEHRLILGVYCLGCDERRNVFPKVESATLAELWRLATPPGGTIWPTPAPLVTESPAAPVIRRPEETAPPGAVKPPERCAKCNCRISPSDARPGETPTGGLCWWCGTPWKTS